MINKYQYFLLENKLTNLLTEANIFYMQKFEEVLNQMKSPIAHKLLSMIGKDIKSNVNYIDITNKEDMVTFHPANGKAKIKHIIVDNGYTYTTWQSLYKLAGIDAERIDELPDGTIGEVIKVFTHSEYKEIPSDKQIAYFVSDEDKKPTFLNIKGVKEIVGGKSQESKIGRVASNLLKSSGEDFNDKDIESFVNEFKSKIAIRNDQFKLFELVEGEKIKYWYLYDNYSKDHYHTLQDSCMRYPSCQNYFGIYTKNPSVCKLLIFRNENDTDQIQGRALVWTLHDGTIFMDRIYSSKDSQVDLFIEYANKNGWYHKERQASSADCPIVLANGNHYGKDLIVQLPLYEFDNYPYMDTLKYLSEKKGTLSNKKTTGSLFLEETDGSSGEICSSCQGNSTVSCGNCDGDGTETCTDCNSQHQIKCTKCSGSGTISNVDGESVLIFAELE